MTMKGYVGVGVVLIFLTSCAVEQADQMAKVMDTAGSTVEVVTPLLGPLAPYGAGISAVLAGISAILYQRAQGRGKEKSYNKGRELGAKEVMEAVRVGMDSKPPRIS